MLLTLENTILAKLHELADPVRAVNEKKYLKSPLKHYGVRVPVLRQIAKSVGKQLGFPDTCILSRKLWEGESHEERMIAIFLLVYKVHDLEWSNFPQIEHMLRSATGWAQLDMLATWLCGELFTKYPAKMTKALRVWNNDSNFWVRRASILTLLGPVRKDEKVFPLFVELSVPLLVEKEFFIRKAIGWVLRELSKVNPQLVEKYVARYGKHMSALTMREATRKLNKNAPA